MSVEPDGFTGAAMAVQGITDATVVLHGQKGCRKGLLSCHRLMPRAGDGVDISSPRYGFESEVPYSGLTSYDYSGDSARKLEETLMAVSNDGYALKVLMNSRGASLVGDDCPGIVDRLEMSADTVICDQDSFGNDCAQGFDMMIDSLIRRLAVDDPRRIPGTAVLIGLSIMHKDWRAVVQETNHLLKSGGLRLVSALGAGCNVSDIAAACNAEYAIAICPEYCERTARTMQRLGVTPIVPEVSPVGFDATESFYENISETTGQRTIHAFEMVAKMKRRAYDAVVTSGTDPFGRTFWVESVRSIRSPLSEWLGSSFGMIEDPTQPDFLFANGITARDHQRSGRCSKGIDIGFPSPSGTDFMKSPLFGLDGSLYLLDGVFNRGAYRRLRREASWRGCDRDGCSSS